MLRSFGSRLFVVVAAVQLVTAIAIGWASVSAAHRWMLGRAHVEGRATAHLLSVAAAPLLAELNFGAVQDLADESRRRLDLHYLNFVEPGGRRVASAGEVPASVPATSPDDPDLPPQQGGSFHFSAPVILQDRVYGTVQFGVPDEALMAARTEILQRSLLVGGIGLALSLLLLSLLTTRMTAGLRRLAAAAARLGGGDTSIRVTDTGGEEIAQLARGFNEMSRALEARVRALEESEERQRSLVDALAEGVVFQDGADRVLACNEAAPRILGVSRNQLMGIDSYDPRWRIVRRDGTPFLPEEHPSVVAFRTGLPQRNVLMGVERTDGQVSWINANANPVFRPGESRPHGTVTSFEDVTDLVNAQARLSRLNTQLEQRVGERTAELVAARDAAEQANRAKSEFLSRMSHELRTPLNAILGFAQVLQLRTEGMPQTAREQLQHIERAGWFLLALIEDVLDLSRIEAGALTVSLEPVAAAAVAAESVRMNEPLAAQAGVAVVFASETADDRALADATRLRQVINNLVSNAIKYNHRGGRVSVTLRDAGKHLAIAVRDTGAGLSPAQLGQLFQPFNRLGAEATGVPGTGIGLVITRRLVELMGGTIEIESTPGAGSTFTVLLQRAAAPPARSSASAAAALASTQPRAPRDVVYIEDNPSNQLLMASTLALRPYVRLHMAATAAQGLELVARLHPRLVIVDIALPDLDGYEVCRRLRRDPGAARMRVIALSANAMKTDVQRGHDAGFDDYLTKPLDLDRFLARFDELMEEPCR